MKIKPYNKNGYIIRISETPLIQMILNGLEAYAIHHRITERSRKRVETLGFLWGHEVLLNNKKLLYSIDAISIETSAERRKSEVTPKDASLELKTDVITSFWPQLDFIGDFHTHTYDKYTDVVSEKGYLFSNKDFKSIQDYSDDWKNYNYRVGIVLAIATMKKRGSKQPQWINNSTIEFTFGNCRMWLKGYVTYLEGEKLLVSEHDDENIYLDCPSLVGIFGEHTPMKKIT